MRINKLFLLQTCVIELRNSLGNTKMLSGLLMPENVTNTIKLTITSTINLKQEPETLYVVWIDYESTF